MRFLNRFSSAYKERESGEATVEFLGVMILFAIPVFYLILCLGTVQATSYAAEAGARQGARLLSVQTNRLLAAQEQIALTFSDYGLEAPEQIEASCIPQSCQGRDAQVVVRVVANAPLPLLPEWMGDRAAIPIQASVSLPVEGVHLR